MGQIDRLAIFKAVDEAARTKMVEAALEFFSQVKKSGNQYFSNNSVSFIQNHEDPRAHGYGVALRLTFDNEQDILYYDQQCPIHLELKKKGAQLCTEPPLVVLTRSEETIAAEDIEEGVEPSEVIRKKRAKGASLPN
ncbi:hypothetical protein B0J18DRAFT_421066 [Chaetomium sp. MPI-SDFR-AT-0129]|nr:hypothetical protein B0J18DRAFT_421066 [Chaetomium sp. MPI-SDFR-AT-0129]